MMFTPPPRSQVFLISGNHRHHYSLEIQSPDMAAIHEYVILSMCWRLHLVCSLCCMQAQDFEIHTKQTNKRNIQRLCLSMVKTFSNFNIKVNSDQLMWPYNQKWPTPYSPNGRAVAGLLNIQHFPRLCGWHKENSRLNPTLQCSKYIPWDCHNPASFNVFMDFLCTKEQRWTMGCILGNTFYMFSESSLSEIHFNI